MLPQLGLIRGGIRRISAIESRTTSPGAVEQRMTLLKKCLAQLARMALNAFARIPDKPRKLPDVIRNTWLFGSRCSLLRLSHVSSVTGWPARGDRIGVQNGGRLQHVVRHVWQARRPLRLC